MGGRVILSNQAKCLKCGDEPWSSHRHDYVECGCGNVFVDGGMDYIRHGWKEKELYKNISIEWNDGLVYEIYKELDIMVRTKINSLGLTCAVARVLRDNGYKIVKEAT